MGASAHTPSSAEDSPSNNSPSMPEPDQPDWHRRAGPVFKFGLISGFALLLLGGLSYFLSLTTSVLEMLVVCAGLSIILGAFGSTATINTPKQGTVLVGVAAVALILFSVLLSELNSRYVRIKITGDIKGANVELVGDESYFGAPRISERSFDFVIFGKTVPSNLALYVTAEDKEETPFPCISINALKPYLASGRTIHWHVDRKNGVLTDGNRLKIANVGACSGTKQESFASAIPSARHLFQGIIPAAYAQSNPTASPDDFDELMSQLQSDTSYIRRNARSKLSEKGVALVRPAIAKLSEKNIDYRLRLGIIVALTEMMRNNKTRRTDISDALGNKGIDLLTEAAGDSDRTIRIYASEFLYDLGDPRAIKTALDAAASASENGRYNYVLITKGAIPYASRAQKEEALVKLKALKRDGTPRTNELIDSVVSTHQ